MNFIYCSTVFSSKNHFNHNESDIFIGHMYMTKYIPSCLKVSLAVQIFSNSVARALEFALTSGTSGFEDAHATIQFIDRLNSLFDILNSRSMRSYGFKFFSNVTIDIKKSVGM